MSAPTTWLRVALVLMIAGCGHAAPPERTSQNEATTNATDSCSKLAVDPADRLDDVDMDAEIACDRSRDGRTAAWSQIAFVSKTWTTLSLRADGPDGRCAHAEIERRMHERCAKRRNSRCCAR